MAPSSGEREAARAAKAKASRVFRRFAPVCGVGIARRKGRYVVKVNLECEPDDGDLPGEIDGVPVVVHVVGRIRKQARTSAG